MNPAWWRGRRVLVTGHTGFKGAWLTAWLEDLGAEVRGFALPDDVRDADAVVGAVRAARSEVVLHLAAQALVREGYRRPAETFAVNVQGTVNVLEAALAAPSVGAVLVVTSDKVYDGHRAARPYTEDSPLGGADPYSASKAAAEMVTASYRATSPTAMGVATARAGNVIGGGDWAADRIVPDAARALAAGEPLVLRYPGATRPWQHVLDPLRGYLALAQHLAEDPAGSPPALNFGPDLASCVPVASLVDALAAHWDGWPGWVVGQEEQPHEAAALDLSSARAAETLGWRPRFDLAASVGMTARWYAAHRAGDDVAELTRSQIAAATAALEPVS